MAVMTNLSQYEIERNKPMPNFIHAVIQTKLSTLLNNDYGKKYLFPGELSLATQPSSTLDICIYPKKKLKRAGVKAKEEEPPITTIEIQSPSQSIDQLQEKIRDLYFPMGVKSAWIVIPALKGIQILLEDGQELFFHKSQLKDPTTDISIDIQRVFEDFE
ncbi:MAG: Uma2 family endonuclease [Bacteroidota bacterium]